MDPVVKSQVFSEGWQKKHWEEDCSELDGKSSQMSSGLRSAGNVLLKSMHDNSTIKEVFAHYTKSIAYAESHSEELLLGYSNRSILSLHIKKYDLCLIDIKEALKLDSSSLRKIKLLTRMITCLKALGKSVENSIVEEVEQIIARIENPETKQKLSASLRKALDSEVDMNFYAFEAEPIPKMIRSKELPCASDAIEISYDETHGRSLTVNRSVLPGEILIVEKPYAVFPTLEERYVICSHCLDFTLTGIPCDHCPCIIFCSKSCKIAAWEKYHKVECRSLSRLMLQMAGLHISFFLHLRSLFTALCENNFDTSFIVAENDLGEKNLDQRTKGFFNGQFLSDKFRCLTSLEDRKDQWHTSKCDGVPKSDLIQVFGLRVYTILQSALSNMNKLQSDQGLQDSFKELIRKIGRIVEINTFTCQDSPRESILRILDADELKEKFIFDDVRDRGLIMASCSALSRHDCTPNACRVFKNGKMMIYSLLPIKTNEQVSVTYSRFSISTPKAERQFHLKDNFFFDCKCFSCEQDIFIDSETYLKNFARVKAEFERHLLKNSSATKNFKKCLIVMGGENGYNDLKQKLLEFLKSKISEAYQTESKIDALKKSFMYGKILMDLFLEIHSLTLIMEECCP